LLMAITSQARASLMGEVMIMDWKTASLLKPSVIKPVITTIEHTLIRKFGGLVDTDKQALRAAIPAIFG
jgi:mRNA interferase MazF